MVMNRLTFQRKLMLLFVGMALLPTVVLVLVSYRLIGRSVERWANHQIALTLTNSAAIIGDASELAHTLERYENLPLTDTAELLAVDEDLVAVLDNLIRQRSRYERPNSRTPMAVTSSLFTAGTDISPLAPIRTTPRNAYRFFRAVRCVTRRSNHFGQIGRPRFLDMWGPDLLRGWKETLGGSGGREIYGIDTRPNASSDVSHPEQTQPFGSRY